MEKAAYTISIHVEVFDEAALIEAAKARALKDGIEGVEIECAGDALQWLLDPGVSPPGCEIVESRVE